MVRADACLGATPTLDHSARSLAHRARDALARAGPLGRLARHERPRRRDGDRVGRRVRAAARVAPQRHGARGHRPRRGRRAGDLGRPHLPHQPLLERQPRRRPHERVAPVADAVGDLVRNAVRLRPRRAGHLSHHGARREPHHVPRRDPLRVGDSGIELPRVVGARSRVRALGARRRERATATSSSATTASSAASASALRDAGRCGRVAARAGTPEHHGR